MSQQQSFWKKLFCVCTGDESNDSKPKSRSIQPNTPIHYNQPKNIQKTLEDSNILEQLKWMNDPDHPIQLIVDNTQQCCFLVLKKKLEVPISKNLQSHSQNSIFDYYGHKKLLFDLQYTRIAPQYVCKFIAGRLKDYQRILEINSQFNQHTIQFLQHDMFVIALTSNQKHLEMGQHNLRELQKDSGYVSTIFGNLSTIRMDWKRMPIDAIFMNLTNFKRDMIENTYKELCNAFKICQNIVVLFAGQKIDFFIDLLARISYQQPEIFLSVALESQEVLINGQIQFTILYIGGCSSVKRVQLVEALRDRILLSKKCYKDYLLPTMLEPIFFDLIDKIGCVKLMNLFLESIYDLKSQEEFTNTFFKTLEKNKLINNEILEDYSQKYPPVLTPQISPLRKPRKNTTIPQQTISFNYEVTQDKTNNTDFLLEGGTFMSNNAPTQNDKIK